MARVETLADGRGVPLDPFSRALVGLASPAAGLLDAVPAGALPPRTTSGRASRDLCDALVAEQERHGLGPASIANARALADGALVVATGQQPGLLASPLLSLHKAAGAIALARRLSQAGGPRVLPVFWIASEDHDWGEANRATVIDAAGAPRDLRLPLEGDLRSVRDVPLPPPAAQALLASLEASLPKSERAAEALALARPPAGPVDLGAWFATMLGRLFGDAGLVVVEPHVVAPWAGPTFAHLVRDAERISSAVAAAGDRLKAAGLPAPLSPSAGTAPLFLRDAERGPRRRVTLEGSRVLLRGQPVAFDRAALEARVLEHPHLASADAVGRLFVQDALLPVVALVGGPTELAYWSQVRAAATACGEVFPAASPRPQATWTDAKSEEALRAFGLGPAEAIEGAEPESPAVPPTTRELEEALATLREHLRERMKAQPEYTRSAREAEDALAAAESQWRKMLEERGGRDLARFRRAATLLRPKGEPQERVLSPLSLVARIGLAELRAGLASLDPLASGHQVVHAE